MEKMLERKKRGQIKGLICHMRLILSYLMLVPNFKILDQVVPEKSLTKISIFITLE